MGEPFGAGLCLSWEGISQVCSPGCNIVPAYTAPRLPSADPATVSNSLQEKQGLFGISHTVSCCLTQGKKTSSLICSQVLDSHKDTHYLGSWERRVRSGVSDCQQFPLRPFLVNLSVIPSVSFRGWCWHSGTLQWVIWVLSHHLHVVWMHLICWKLQSN